jgi:hypothetical protein
MALFMGKNYRAMFNGLLVTVCLWVSDVGDGLHIHNCKCRLPGLNASRNKQKL